MFKFIWTNDINSKVYKDLLSLRKEVFVGELGSDISIEIEGEESCNYLAIYQSLICVGTGRIRLINSNTARLQRIAIKKEFRGRGLGHELICELESGCHKLGVDFIEICASEKAFDFYIDNGYEKSGGFFMRGGIKHVIMKKCIKNCHTEV